MGDLPSNAFDGEDDCPGGRIQIASTEEIPAQIEIIIKAAKAAKNPDKEKGQCNLRLEKQSIPPPGSPAPAVVTPVRGDIRKGLGMRKSIMLGANQALFLRCTKADEGEEDSIVGGDDVCRFTVTYLG